MGIIARLGAMFAPGAFDKGSCMMGLHDPVASPGGQYWACRECQSIFEVGPFGDTQIRAAISPVPRPAAAPQLPPSPAKTSAKSSPPSRPSRSRPSPIDKPAVPVESSLA